LSVTKDASIPKRPRLELCWGTLGLATVEDLVDAAAAAGFDAVTVPSSVCAALVQDEPRLRALRHRMRERAILITIIDPLVRGLPGIRGRDAMPDEYRDLLDATANDCGRFATALGATVVNVAHVTGVPTPLDQICDTLDVFASMLGEHGVKGAVEFIPGTGIPDLQTACAIIQAVGAPNLGITFDTWHFSRAGGHPSELAHLEPGSVFALQINDAHDPVVGGPHIPGAERLLPGEGEIPIVDLLRALLRDQPDLYVGVEVFSEALRHLGPRRAAVAAFNAAEKVVESLTPVESPS
jgi:sugar phosphate isomerase/epimerase